MKSLTKSKPRDYSLFLNKDSTLNAVLMAWAAAIGWRYGYNTKARVINLIGRDAETWTTEDAGWLSTFLPLAHEMFEAIVRPGPDGPTFNDVMGKVLDFKEA